MTIDERLENTNFPLPAIREINTAKHDSSISLGLGELKNFPVDEKIINAIKGFNPSTALSYAPNGGLIELRKHIATEQNKQDGFLYSEANVITTIGVQNAMYAAIKTLSGLGAKRILIPEIHFGIYKKIPSQFKMEVICYKLTKNFGIDIEYLQSIIKQDDLLLINSPSNPTGRVLSNYEQAELCSLLKAKLTNGYIISDEIYNKLIYDGETPNSFSKFFERTIILNGISKSGATAGLRVGWIICRSKKMAQAITSANASIISCPPTLNQIAAIPVVKGETQNSINNYNKILKEHRDIACSILDELGINYTKPTGSFYLFPYVKDKIEGDIKEFCINLAKKENGVVVIPGIAFGAPDYIRISLASSDIKEGMNRLKEALKLSNL